MRMRVLTVLLIGLTGAPALALPPVCEPGTVRKIRLSGRATRLRFAGAITPAVGFDPLTNGLAVDLGFEPEADPSGTLVSATLPASGFQAVGHETIYRDTAGAIGGITLVRLTPDGIGGLTVSITRKGPAIPTALRVAPLRLTLAAGTACARTCPSRCRPVGAGTLRCSGSTDSKFCGVMSGCELLGVTEGGYSGRDCLLPYPSSAYEVADASSPSGRRLAIPRFAMPPNAAGVHMDSAHWNTLDGWSPGPIITAYFRQGVDLATSGVPPVTDFDASLSAASPTVLIEADTAGCARVEHFGENDVSGDAVGLPVAPPNQVFMIRPGRRLENGRRYIVALRGLVGQDGEPIAPSQVFRALRDGTPSGSTAVEARREHMEGLFTTLETRCGINRGTLLLAWDFTTASDDNLTRWLLHMRDDAFGQLGSAAPAFSVTSVEDNPFAGDTRVCRRVRGTYTVPLYMTANAPGALLNLDPATNLPAQNGVAADVPFTAMIPCSLANSADAGRPIYYGHGLLGSGNEVTAGNLRTLANTYGFVIAATDWQGFASADLPTIVGFISDLSEFRKLPERLHQGILNQLFLARLMKHPQGLGADPAFRYGGVSVIDPSDVFFYGNSQGGIEGGVVMALAQDSTRGVLGVPAAIYSTLLHRSRDFDPYFALLRANYPDDLQRNLTLPLIQQLWDRAEPNGWYHHTLPGTLPNTPAHQVLVHMATSDDEVSNLGTEIMVRSMGFPQVSPVVKHYFGIPEQAAPFGGSAMVESDGHFGPIPVTNTPPGDNTAHGDMRGRPAIQRQIDAFLRSNGLIGNFCAGPCDPE